MKKKKLKVIFIFSLILFAVYLILIPFIHNYKLKKSYRYTIAKIIKFEYPPNGGPDVIFEYYVNNKRYEGFYDTGGYKDSTKIGDRFYIKFYPPNPNVSRINTNFKVPDSIIAPPKGWAKMP